MILSEAAQPSLSDWWHWMMQDPPNRLPILLDHYKLAIIMIVAFGLIAIFLFRNGFDNKKPSNPQHFPTGRRAADPQDEKLYANIGELVEFFVAEMAKVGNPGVTHDVPEWRSTSGSMTQLRPEVKAHPIEIKLSGPAWWQGKSCITPDGQWEYHDRTCVSYREGESDEFAAWWVISSRGNKQSLKVGDPYPFNRYRVYEPGGATLPHAATHLGGLMEGLLKAHCTNDVVHKFQALRAG